MELNTIERIHERYEAYMDEFHLSGSYGVWIPFFKVTLQMDYLYESDLKMVEDFICRCIERGISVREKIMFVLALDEEVFEAAVKPLLDSNYLATKNINGQVTYQFTTMGTKLIKKRTRYEPKNMFTDWYYDGLSDQYKLDFFGSSEKHQFKKFKDIEKATNQIVITPTVFPKYESDLHFKELSRQALDKIDEVEKVKNENIESQKIVNIENFELLTDREVYYHEYRILVFKNSEGEFKLLAHDPCGKNYIDPQVTESIMNLADDNYFDSLIVDDAEQVSIDSILNALKNYANEMINLVKPVSIIENELMQSSTEDKTVEVIDIQEPKVSINERHEDDILDNEEMKIKVNEYEQSLTNLKSLKTEDVSIQYIMNYNIREQFLSYLKNAEKSLYIISPWMNNYIINDEFKRDLINLLKRGVKVRIICGITDHLDEKQDFRDLNTQKIAKELVRIAEPYHDLFKLKFGQTHEKLLICDDIHYINGSFNFLSYSGGDGDNKYFRNEGSTYCHNKTLINETIRLRFNF
ncbi:phospholipase D-like domain-containing protein [Exiguobacterium acetylicum]|uniref:phospholipase D-like domain-containing protein n=1 Tax=Exiguobacterium acetylicum TaxID=41170 RepID=UPI001CA6D5A5|nr:phospholipase D-like domain-containing protein [Exiguobacterium acetylicum]QZY86403.1 hypothetical protein K7G97_14225 [Exiguobacterium acetylicum]